MSQARGFSDKIIRIYLLGASLLLAFFLYAFHGGILLTENTVIERRINMVAPFHLKQFESSSDSVITIDPLLTIYDAYSILPSAIQSKIKPEWTGSIQVMLDDEQEFQIVAQKLMINGQDKIVYAIENSDSLEWDDTGFLLIELTLASIGILLFLVTMAYMVRAAKRIAAPFHEVAEKLETNDVSQFDEIQPRGDITRELVKIVTSLNAYRTRLAKHIEREKSFTRYVSHELRTPMMLIKGAISNLRHQTDENGQKSIGKIVKATDEMQQLTQTFLVLAREGNLESDLTSVDDTFLNQLTEQLEDKIQANQIAFEWQLKSPFKLSCNHQLFSAVVLNLLNNAFACSVDGKVSLFVSEQGLQVIDDGVGLDAKPRGYEGFGVGLVLVDDICTKYGWVFNLEYNESRGCTASITFTEG